MAKEECLFIYVVHYGFVLIPALVIYIITLYGSQTGYPAVEKIIIFLPLAFFLFIHVNAVARTFNIFTIKKPMEQSFFSSKVIFFNRPLPLNRSSSCRRDDYNTEIVSRVCLSVFGRIRIYHKPHSV